MNTLLMLTTVFITLAFSYLNAVEVPGSYIISPNNSYQLPSGYRATITGSKLYLDCVEYTERVSSGNSSTSAVVRTSSPAKIQIGRFSVSGMPSLYYLQPDTGMIIDGPAGLSISYTSPAQFGTVNGGYNGSENYTLFFQRNFADPNFSVTTPYVAIKIEPTPNYSSSSVTPINTVVIPENSTGSVNVILESSTDLVNWATALPGSYDPNTTKRFFRLRAVAQ
jgi:hypothetical protein